MGRRDRERKRDKVRSSDPADREERRKQLTGFVPKHFRIPDGMKQFKFAKAGNYRIDIVPYVVKKNPMVADAGITHWERTFFTHTNIGASPRDHHCCPLSNFGKPCNLCVRMSRLSWNDPDEKKEKTLLKPKERQLFLVIDHADRAAGVQLYESAHGGGPVQMFGSMLDAKIKALDEGDKKKRFFSLRRGFSLKVSVEEGSFDGSKTYKPVNIEFIDRPVELSEDLLDQVPCLDDLLLPTDSDELERMYTQAPEPDSDNGKDGSDSKKRRGKKVKKTAEAFNIKVGSNVEHADHGECEVVKVSKDGTSLTIKDEKGKEHKAIDPRDVDLLEDNKKPAGKKGDKKKDDKPADKKPKDKDDKDDDDSDSDDSDSSDSDDSDSSDSDDSDSDDSDSSDSDDSDSDDSDSDDSDSDGSKEDKKPTSKKPAKK